MVTREHKKVCVVGLGYIGLPTAAVLASRGHAVHGVEIDDSAREIINSGKAHVVEPDLDMLVQAGVQSGRLNANKEPAKADVFILCVPTPVGEEQGADLSYVKDATQAIMPFLEEGNLVILESTSPPGTTEMIHRMICDDNVHVTGEVMCAHAPERVLPGRILYEVVSNDRIVGGINRASTIAACEFYASFVQGKLISCSARMAEMAKLVENASRDSQIAFANELSVICDKQGLDVRELIDIANRHPRVDILQPGCGVGGHCIAVDPWFLIHMAGEDARMMRAAREVNDSKPNWVVEKVVARAARLKSPVIACLGASYKPDIDDMRGSPALRVINSLADASIGRVVVVEPNCEEGDGPWEHLDLESALAVADIVVVLVAHSEFRSIRQERLAEKILIDACGVTHRSRFLSNNEHEWKA